MNSMDSGTVCAGCRCENTLFILNIIEASSFSSVLSSLCVSMHGVNNDHRVFRVLLKLLEQ